MSFSFKKTFLKQQELIDEPRESNEDADDDLSGDCFISFLDFAVDHCCVDN